MDSSRLEILSLSGITVILRLLQLPQTLDPRKEVTFSLSKVKVSIHSIQKMVTLIFPTVLTATSLLLDNTERLTSVTRLRPLANLQSPIISERPLLRSL